MAPRRSRRQKPGAAAVRPEAGREATEPTPGYLVVVGASAGGIEALSVLASSLKRDFAAPVVIAQHLDPKRASHLGAILERRSALPVVLVTERVLLEPGHIYVVPSNRHVVILDGHVDMEDAHGERPRPSVDLLLSTAARSYGDRLVAVVLTGSGSDGAAGAVDVKAAGGVVIIQNPNTAAYPSMPLALPPTAVDHVVELGDIGALLHDLVTGAVRAEAAPPHERGVLADILAVVGEHASIDFRPYKPGTLLRRITRRMVVTRTQTLAEYHKHLQAQPQEVAELVMALLIRVTEFFRDPDAFDYLGREVLPGLIARARERGKTLRVWSAGCATGEEAFSLSLLIAEQLGRDLPEWTVKVFATDVDPTAVGFARRGLFPANTLANLAPEVVSRYFEPSDQGFRVSKLLRQMVIFGQQDLTRGVPFPRIDLVVCRNLLIYFNPALQEEVLDVFAYALFPSQGFLFLGKAETARPSRAVFEIVDKKWKVYRCVQGPQPARLRPGPPAAAAVARPELTPARRLPEPGRGTEMRSTGEDETVELELGQLRRFNELLLRQVPAGITVIDRQYRIVSMNAAARRLLSMRDTGVDQDFLHAVRGLPYEEVRSAIDQAFRERAPVALSEVWLSTPVGEPRCVTLHVAALPPEGLALDCVLLTVLDATEQARATQRLDVVEVEKRQLAEDLGTTNRRLIETNKELQDANEELQAANEELMLTQEELQATNEEFEATNEELQATNEELETNNEELQATNEELETTNEEVEARTAELQQLNRILLGERLRLSEMVELAPFYIVVLRGPALVVEALNPSSLQLFGGREALGRPFDEVCCDSSFDPLLEGVREVVRRDRRWTSGRLVTQVERPGQGSARRELVYTVVPSHDSTGKVEGAVMYAEDVTDKRAREEQERADMLKLMIEHAHPAGLGLYEARTGQLLQASPRYLDILRRTAGSDLARLERGSFREVTLLESPEAADRALASVRQNGEPIRFSELRNRLLGDDRETVWDWTLIPIAFGAGEPEHTVRDVVVCVFEVTEQVQLREELQQLDQVKNEFLAMASHELRTPLVPLTAYVDLMDKLVQEARASTPGGWADEAARVVHRFRKQITHLTRLTDDLLDVARLQSGTFSVVTTPVDLRVVVEEAREQASQLPGAPTIRLSADGAEPLIVQGDEGRLVQATYNLLSNAIRYASDGGAIDLRLHRDGPGRAHIEVQDYGPGITPEDAQNLFRRFYRGRAPVRSSRSGLGLGLFICKQIAERHGGTVTVDSTIGQGARFLMDLPVEGGEGRTPVREQRPADRPKRARKGAKKTARARSRPA